MEPLGLADRPLGIVRIAWIDLDAHSAIEAIGPLVDGKQAIAGHLDVLDRQPVEQRFGRQALRHSLLECSVIVMALGDGELEDRGVGRYTHHSLAYPIVELSRRKTPAPDEIDPYALSKRTQLLDAIRHDASFSA